MKESSNCSLYPCNCNALHICCAVSVVKITILPGQRLGKRLRSAFVRNFLLNNTEHNGLKQPITYNCIGYESVHMLRQLESVVDILLPNHLKNAKTVVQYVYETYGNQVWLSLMNRYTPLFQVADIPERNRKVTKRAYRELVKYAVSLEAVD